MSFNAILFASPAVLAVLAVAAPAPAPQAASSASSMAMPAPMATGTAAESSYSAQSSSFSSMMAAITSGTSSGSDAIPTSFSSDSAVPYSSVTNSTYAPLRSLYETGVTSHGPFSGTATTTGAVSTTALGTEVPQLGPAPTATYYNTNGRLQNPQPIPYEPAGGLGTNGTEPRYMVNSDFDYQSLQLGVYQEWIELDLFHDGLARFSKQEFYDAGLTDEDMFYIEFMADQESGHATLLSNMIGETAAPQCTYNYPYNTVAEWLDFNQRLTRWGESGVLGFQAHLDSREVAQMLMQSITTESRQQMTFRQMSGLFPMPVWFETGYPQSWAWTYLAPYISSCPENTTRLAWQNFPVLHIVNNPSTERWSPNDTANYEVTGRRVGDPSNSTIPESESCKHVNTTGYSCGPAISRNHSEPMSFAGKQIFLEWDAPGQAVGPNNSYVTSTTAKMPAYVLWVNQLNITYSDLHLTSNNSGYTFQPEASVYETDSMINGTMAMALTDTNDYYTPFNLSNVNPHVAALGLYTAG